MEYARLGRTGLEVSRLCLGCMSYAGGPTERHGWLFDAEGSRPFYRKALDLGINFFDTANIYSTGASEETMRTALLSEVAREDVVILTKVYNRMRPGPNGAGLSRKAIMAEIDASLKRLGTDYVDVYMIHRWDYETPLEETLGALHDVVKAGKARYLGASSMFAWQFCKAIETQKAHGWTRFARGLIAAGGRVATGLRAVELFRDGNGRVAGLGCATARGHLRLRARRGVVLASGGFERDTARRAAHFAGPVDLVASAPGNTGDAAAMAEAAGARLARMDQANIAPALPARLGGADLPVGTFHHREPGAILVDARGRRFVNEYLFNLGEVLSERDPATGAARHLPAWMITDRTTLREAPLLRHFLSRAPGWAREAGSAEDLAARIGLPPETLAGTIARFNRDASMGVDRDFGRLPERLRPIGTPLLALPFNLCFLSTKGGPRTDADARVIDTAGAPIPGLYCAGVAMANPFGTRAVGSGTTLGPNMTWGWIAARHILENA